eukprot:2723274-Rhodomonas_salina.6
MGMVAAQEELLAAKGQAHVGRVGVRAAAGGAAESGGREGQREEPRPDRGRVHGRVGGGGWRAGVVSALACFPCTLHCTSAGGAENLQPGCALAQRCVKNIGAETRAHAPRLSKVLLVSHALQCAKPRSQRLRTCKGAALTALAVRGAAETLAQPVLQCTRKATRGDQGKSDGPMAARCKPVRLQQSQGMFGTKLGHATIGVGQGCGSSAHRIINGRPRVDGE